MRGFWGVQLLLGMLLDEEGAGSSLVPHGQVLFQGLFTFRRESKDKDGHCLIA